MDAAALTSRNVLIVDDEPLVGQLVAALIERVGYIPVVVQSARVALEVAASQALGLVITDMQMPDVDGVALCRNLQAQHPQLPVIGMSGSGPIDQNADLQKGPESGSAGHRDQAFQAR